MANKTQWVESGTQLEKDFDRSIRPMLDASVGGRFRQHCDFEVISGESKVWTYGTPGNYETGAPNMYKDEVVGTAGGTRTMEITPHPLYGYEILTYEERQSLDEGRIDENTWFMKSLVESLEIGEDIEIIKAMESVENKLPLLNKMGDVTKPLYHPKNLRAFKAALVYARGRFKGKKSKGDYGAWAVMHHLDWAKIELLAGGEAIFADKDYQHMTGIDGQSITTVCGVAIETVETLDRAYGDEKKKRNYLVEPGTVWICTLDNIKLVSWENSARSAVKEDLLNGDRLSMVVSKSIGAKVKNINGLWKFTAKKETTLDYEEVFLGETENPIKTKASAK